MASIELTQITLAQVLPTTTPATLFVVAGSESLIAINPLTLVSVESVYQQNGSFIPNVRKVNLTGGGCYVTDSYATVKAYIDAL
jgi:hypothetical protein|tara:strand:- start:12 stop:263 length:252 start_codon:yes stop_codon:yes gene_type:complete